ncbi:hypothetical protein [Luteimonas sp. SDU101]|uniref:hypothetical protein n=1 Tax=Luteimonas sp. SDU101 TaxID=3422593 RepID=UPI003EBAA2A3
MPNVGAREALAGSDASMLADEMIVDEVRFPENLMAARTDVNATVNATSASV